MRWLIAAIFGNLGYVGSNVWRSAQRWYLYPIYVYLVIFKGVRTRINLATDPVKDKQDWLEERFWKWFEWINIHVEYITYYTVHPPMPPYLVTLMGEKVMTRLDKGSSDLWDKTCVLLAFEDLKKALDNGGVIIGCEGGQDRTGGVVALFKFHVLKTDYWNIVDDWRVFGIPGNNWQIWFWSGEFAKDKR